MPSSFAFISTSKPSLLCSQITSPRQRLASMLVNQASHPINAVSLRAMTSSSSRRTSLRRTRALSVSAGSSATATATQHFITLSDGMRLEVLKMDAQTAATTASSRPPLLFVHGSYHAAWCWAENFMPYFSAAGYECVAVSLRAQGASDRGTLKVAGDLESHAADLAAVVSSLPRPPVVVGHSFGGLVVEKYASLLGGKRTSTPPPIAGVALLCSVPPSGNKDIIVRITKRSIVDSFNITMSFVFRTFAKSLDAARQTFFSSDIPLGDLQRYQARLAEASPVRLLDLSALNKTLPLPPLADDVTSSLPAFVAGGLDDFVVDLPAVDETAAYFGLKKPVLWPAMAHDCMLDTRWEQAAASLKEWLDSL